WQPATNGEIVASTDASTTWLITLLDTPFEVYRVRTSVTLEAGIHAERTLHANAGIEMGGETWTNFPDMETYASTGSVATVASDLATHTSATNNPHNVTAQQIGALPLSGGTLTNHLTLQKNANDGTGTPFLIFQKGTAIDGKADWRFVVNNGKMYVQWRTTKDWVWNNPIIFDTNSISAGSFIGCGDLLTVNSANLGNFAAEMERRIGAIETNMAPWNAESWTFILTNGSSVTKSVLVYGGD
ncbi:MAG: hypothetical protein ILO10_02375, partial [Kiritimatiellae bacterium]|nr:hypothetical protein [Kiritimatiellia bacterium]